MVVPYLVNMHLLCSTNNVFGEPTVYCQVQGKLCSIYAIVYILRSHDKQALPQVHHNLTRTYVQFIFTYIP